MNEDNRPLLEYQRENLDHGFVDPELLLDYMRYFVLFEDDGDSLIKKIAACFGAYCDEPTELKLRSNNAHPIVHLKDGGRL